MLFSSLWLTAFFVKVAFSFWIFVSLLFFLPFYFFYRLRNHCFLTFKSMLSDLVEFFQMFCCWFFWILIYFPPCFWILMNVYLFWCMRSYVVKMWSNGIFRVLSEKLFYFIRKIYLRVCWCIFLPIYLHCRTVWYLFSVYLIMHGIAGKRFYFYPRLVRVYFCLFVSLFFIFFWKVMQESEWR